MSLLFVCVVICVVVVVVVVLVLLYSVCLHELYGVCLFVICFGVCCCADGTLYG